MLVVDFQASEHLMCWRRSWRMNLDLRSTWGFRAVIMGEERVVLSTILSTIQSFEHSRQSVVMLRRPDAEMSGSCCWSWVSVLQY